MKVSFFITHKRSESYSDCCDRFCLSSSNRRMAVSDGISQSIFSGEWAEILTNHYADGVDLFDSSEKSKLCNLWLDQVQSHVEEMKKAGVSTWRLERRLLEKNGAGATFCGISFKNESDWEGFVLGDSCLIEVVDEGGLYKISIHSSNEDEVFDNYPDYLDSFESNSGKGQPKQLKGKISNSSFLLLVTDPFASFLSRHKETVTSYINQILAVKDHKGYCELVDEWRSNGMSDDDSTLGIIEYDGRSTVKELHVDDLSGLRSGDNVVSTKIQQAISKFRGVGKMSKSLSQILKKKNSKRFCRCQNKRK